MQRLIYPQTNALTEKQRKGLMVIAPILIGSVAYGASISFMIAANLYQIFF